MTAPNERDVHSDSHGQPVLSTDSYGDARLRPFIGERIEIIIRKVARGEG